MTRQMPLWYIKEQNIFETLTRDHPRIEVVRVPGGSVEFIIIFITYFTKWLFAAFYVQHLFSIKNDSMYKIKKTSTIECNLTKSTQIMFCN